MITKILITGNHHTPAIELINQLKKDRKFNWQIYYISDLSKSDTHLTNTIIPKLKINFFSLASGKHNRRYWPETILGIPKTIKALFKSYSYVKKIKPQVVVSFGGYISVPIVIASYFQKIPSITHEQTVTNSLSTKINSFFVNKIALSFNETSQIAELPISKVIVTGNLLRSQIFSTKSKKFDHLSKDLSKFPLLYITAGAQGSTSINQIILKLLPQLTKKYTIIHHTGRLEFESIKSSTTNFSHYLPLEYVGLYDIGWVLNHAQLLISRSGANTCQEIVALSKKSILIPLPFTQQNEQFRNALWVKNKLPKITTIIDQSVLNENDLFQSIEKNISIPYLSPTKTNQDPNYRLLSLIHEIV